MSTVLVEPTFDITSKNNIVTLLKLYGVNILLSITISLIIALMLNTVGLSALSIFGLVIIVLMGQLYTISLFEKWDGCYKKVE